MWSQIHVTRVSSSVVLTFLLFVLDGKHDNKMEPYFFKPRNCLRVFLRFEILELKENVLSSN